MRAIDAIQFDAKIITDAMTFRRARREVQLTGRGGTNLGPVLAYLEEHRDCDGPIAYTWRVTAAIKLWAVGQISRSPNAPY